MSERYFLGLDIGGTNARAALVELSCDATGGSRARILGEQKQRIREDRSPERVSALVGEALGECARQASVPLEQVQGIGMGVAGQLSADARVVLNAPNLDWRRVEFASMVEQRCPGLPVKLANDLAAIVWGESQLGAGQGFAHLWAVYVGTGIGSGLVLDGRLYRGGGGKAGEVGHSKLVGGSGQCGCGQVGCLEALAGGKAIERRLAEDLAAGRAEGLQAFLGVGELLTASHAERAHEAGVAYAEALWEELSDALCSVLSAGLAILNPSAFLLGGGVLQGCPRLRSLLVEKLAARTVAVAWQDLELLSPKLGDDAGILGAAMLCAD
ncbi:MAG: ROK family protein [Myxococcota bacterium]|nr:ROK family protein [Myxococcota bacterium]